MRAPPRRYFAVRSGKSPVPTTPRIVFNGPLANPFRRRHMNAVDSPRAISVTKIQQCGNHGVIT
jgi:hypothetical protein